VTKGVGEVVTRWRARNSDRELTRDTFGLLPWTSADDRVRFCGCRQDAWEHLMQGFSRWPGLPPARRIVGEPHG
jgi:hypothetical protein